MILQKSITTIEGIVLSFQRNSFIITHPFSVQSVLESRHMDEDSNSHLLPRAEQLTRYASRAGDDERMTYLRLSGK